MRGCMAEKKTCPDCGAALPDDAPEGFCPQCLLAAGVSQATQVSQAQTRASGAQREDADQPSGIAQDASTLFGDYELLEEIARGGMGIVYKARQRRLDRIVAVKLILAGQFAGKQIAQRFRSEAGAAAVLQHPNIVAVHDVGVEEGQHFFSMDYVEGQNLAEVVGNRPLPAQKAARYVKLIAEAIHYAHGQGILHRDLKPSNVLIDAATDQPRVTDFGLAKRLDGDSSLTLTGQVLGSPNFMPPEQASAQRGKVGRHSDVYGLGGILFYSLTARAPFQGATLETTIHEVLNTEPLSPRVLNPSVPRDLETICLKCLEKESSRRYQSAQALADELGRFLNDEPIHARPVSQTERVWRWCRRKPVIASLSAATVLLLLALGIGSPIAALRINAARNTARQSLYAADMKQVQQAWESGNARLAVNLLEAQQPPPGQTDLRGFEWRYFWKLSRGEQEFTWRGHSSAVARVSFSRDGQSIISLDQDGFLKFWSTANRERSVPIKSMHLEDMVGFVSAFLLSPDGKTLATAGHTIKLLDPGTLQESRPSITGNLWFAQPIAFSADGRWLAVFEGSTASSRIRVWEVATGHRAFSTEVFDGSLLTGCLSPDGNMLVAGGDGGLFKLWDRATGRELPLAGHEISETVRSVVFVPAGKTIAFTDGDAIRLLNLSTETKQTTTLRAESNSDTPCILAFSPDGTTLAAGTFSGSIELWDVPSRRRLRFFHGHTSRVNSVAFSLDGQSVISGAEDATVRLWKITGKGGDDVIHQHSGSDLSSVAVSPDGKTIAMGSPDGTIKLSDSSTKSVRAALPGHKQRISSLAYSPDGTIVASASADASLAGEVKLWSATSGARLTTLEGLSNAVSGLAFSPDGKTLALACPYAAELWDVADRRLLTTLVGHKDRVRCVAFAADGRTLASGSSDHTVKLWGVASKKEIATLPAGRQGIDSVAFSRDGRLLASGGEDSLVRLWNVKTKKLLATLAGHKAKAIACLTFAGDDKTLISGGADGTVRLWNIAAQREVAVFDMQSKGVISVEFSQDGNTLTAACADGTIRWWSAPALDEIAKMAAAESDKPLK